MKREESRYIKRRRGAVFRNCCQRFPKISQGSRSGTLSNFLRKFLSCWLGSDPFRTDKLRVVFIQTTCCLYTNVMLFFRNEMAKTLSLTWSKKNLIGPETGDPSSSRAEPSRAGRPAAVHVGSLPLSPNCLSSHSEKTYLYHSNFLLLADVGYFPMTSYSFNWHFLGFIISKAHVIYIHLLIKAQRHLIDPTWSTCKTWNDSSKNQVLGQKAPRRNQFLEFVVVNQSVCLLRFDLEGIRNDD